MQPCEQLIWISSFTSFDLTKQNILLKSLPSEKNTVKTPLHWITKYYIYNSDSDNYYISSLKTQQFNPIINNTYHCSPLPTYNSSHSNSTENSCQQCHNTFHNGY